MQITFWGVRGSYPVPGAATVKYGGQTSCVEARTASGETVIVDAGTGMRALLTAADELHQVIGGITRHEFFPMPLEAVPGTYAGEKNGRPWM